MNVYKTKNRFHYNLIFWRLSHSKWLKHKNVKNKMKILENGASKIVFDLYSIPSHIRCKICIIYNNHLSTSEKGHLWHTNKDARSQQGLFSKIIPQNFNFRRELDAILFLAHLIITYSFGELLVCDVPNISIINK